MLDERHIIGLWVVIAIIVGIALYGLIPRIKENKKLKEIQKENAKNWKELNEKATEEDKWFRLYWLVWRGYQKGSKRDWDKARKERAKKWGVKDIKSDTAGVVQTIINVMDLDNLKPARYFQYNDEYHHGEKEPEEILEGFTKEFIKAKNERPLAQEIFDSGIRVDYRIRREKVKCLNHELWDDYIIAEFPDDYDTFIKFADFDKIFKAKDFNKAFEEELYKHCHRLTGADELIKEKMKKAGVI